MRKSEDDNFENKVMDILKENNKPLDGVDGFLIQVGESIRKIHTKRRLSVQIQMLSFLNRQIEESNEDELSE